MGVSELVKVLGNRRGLWASKRWLADDKIILSLNNFDQGELIFNAGPKVLESPFLKGGA
jgi:hypothetical protein